MNEEIEYAEMLEIPVSTVNVIRKKHPKNKRKAEPPFYPNPQPVPDLKDSVIAQVNDKLVENADETITADAQPFAEGVNSNGEVLFDDVPERIDTVRLFGENERPFFEDMPQSFEEDNEEFPIYPYKNDAERKLRKILGVEFAVACALCGGIFLTNVFVPGSAINTFFRAMSNPATETALTDNRAYSDFELSPVVSELSDAELTLSETGVLSFTDECCVYPAADGTVSDVTKTDDGLYTVKISHSDSFTGVIHGLDYVYYAVGEDVKSNVPVGFSKGEAEVQVTMYSQGELLNCFELTEENCLAWISEE